MRVHSFQHVPFEGLGSIEPYLDSKGYGITKTKFFESADIPDINEIDFLIIMGGSMSVNDEDKFPWLIREKRFIQNFIGTGKPVLGVCLGAQLIANSMGVKVYQNIFKEIGWFPIEGILSNNHSIFNFPSLVEVFHWHGETFDIPKGASLLARSEGCENQAFQIDDSVIGLQFHLEITPESANSIVSSCRHQLVPSKYVQTEEQILSANNEQYGKINQIMEEVISFFI